MKNNKKRRKEILDDTEQIINDLNDISDIEEAVKQIIVDFDLNNEDNKNKE